MLRSVIARALGAGGVAFRPGRAMLLVRVVALYSTLIARDGID